MASMESEITRIDNDIQRLIQRRDGLLRKQKGLWAGRNEISQPLVHRLDSDVLGMIFEAAAAYAFDQPLILGSVCQKWRATAVGTARLWENIYINIPGRPWGGDASSELFELYEEQMRRKENRLNGWLDRSGSVPLIVSFHAAPFPLDTIGSQQVWGDFLRLQRKLTHIIMDHSQRWHSVTLRAPSYLRCLLNDAGVLGSLRTLRLLPPTDRKKFVPRGAQQSDVESFLRAPIRELVLEDDLLDMYDLPVAWDSLTSVIIDFVDGISIATALSILSAGATNLHDCSLKISNIRDLDGPVMQVTFPKLESLALLIAVDGVGLEEVMPRMQDIGGGIVAKALQSFRVECTPLKSTRRILEWPFNSLLGSKMTSLSFNLDGLGPHAIVTTLACIPSLRSLTLTNITPMTIKGVLSILISGVDGQVICPRLTEIRIDLYRWYDDPIEEMFKEVTRLVECRIEENRETAPLKRVWGRSSTFPRSRNLSHKIKLLRQKGVDIEWAYSTTKQIGVGFDYGDEDTEDESHHAFPFRV
ncbi:hypothetical protein VNI00_018850 [Paramarasmius palmivorus]|uniref:F-box domain-containing protein n=1 Tax=Paramarasmius palmivorus TaxID=297713 RepID=A0AAW0AWA6_9AGAR